MNEKLDKIYKYLSTQNIKNLPPTYAEFETMMQDDGKATKIHSYLLSNNVKGVDSDFNTFSEFVGRKKKVDSLSSADFLSDENALGTAKSQIPLELRGTPEQPLPSAESPFKTPEFQYTEPKNYLKEGKDIKQPVEVAKTFYEKLTGAAGVFDQKLASMFDGLDYVQNLLSDNLNQVLVGKKEAEELRKMREEGFIVDYPTNPSIPTRPFNAIAEAIRWTASGVKPLPNTIGGNILSGMAAIIPDIMAAIAAPEIKTAQLFQKIGIPTLSKFGMIMGAEGAIENTKLSEDGTPMQQLTAPAIGAIEGYMTGQMFDWMGGTSSQIGTSIANKLLPIVKTQGQVLNKALLQHGTSSLTNALFFGSYGNLEEFARTGKISAETFATNAGMGIALSARDMGKLLFAKGLNTLAGTPTDVIVRSAQSDTKSEDISKQAQEKIDNLESGKSINKEGDLVMGFMLAKQAELKAMADEVANNYDGVVKAINESSMPKSGKDWLINKVNEVVNETDERAQKVKPISDEIKDIDAKLESIKKNQFKSSVEKEIESEPLEAKKEKLKFKLIEAYGKFKPKEKEEIKEAPTGEVAQPVQKTEEFTYREHRANIEQKFRDSFSGIPKDQVEGALALMDARAKSWASETGKSADEWYDRIADVKEGEFQDKSTPKLYQLPDGRQVMGMAMPEVTNGFYSPIEKRLLDFKQEKASVNKWKEIIGKGDEATFTGVTDWLSQLKPDQTLTKAEISQFMKDNRIEVVEVVKDSEGSSNDEENGVIGREGTKFQQYQLPGEKENYKEVLVTMPAKELTKEERLQKIGYKIGVQERNGELTWTIRDNTGFVLNEGVTKEEVINTLPDSQVPIVKNEQNFYSTHYEKPNILVHLRMNTRTDSEGKKVLFLEEVQSDWGQKGKREGFEGEKLKEAEKAIKESGIDYKVKADGLIHYYDKEGDEIPFALVPENIRKYIGQIVNDAKGIPSAPFVTDTNAWTKLGLKVALKEAIKQGVDKIAWTTGEQQAQRYKESLVAEIEEIESTSTGLQNPQSERGLTFIPFDGRGGAEGIYLEVDESGKITYETNTGALGKMVGKSLSDVLTKGMAEDIMSRPKDTKFKPENLKINSQGMIGFYGSPQESKLGIVGNIAKSLFKQEPKTSEIVVSDNNIQYRTYQKKVEHIKRNSQRMEDIIREISTASKEKAKELGDEYNFLSDTNRSLAQDVKDTERRVSPTLLKERKDEVVNQHSIDITPALKAEVEKGMPLFQINPSVTETSTFKKWFGKSKVIDKKGEPLVVYHATNAEFDEFKEWIYVTEEADYADKVATMAGKSGEGKNIVPLYANIENPLDLRDLGIDEHTISEIIDILKGNGVKISPKVEAELRLEYGENRWYNYVSSWKLSRNRPAFRHLLEENEFDGVVQREALLAPGLADAENPEADAWIAIKPTQVKSATGNIGVFSTEKGSILEQKGKGKPKGAIETLADGKVIIHALSNPNFSTMVHEITHVFEKDLSGDEIKTIEKWSGKKQGTREFSEAFARGGERYLRDGKSPTKELTPIFEKFKAWLTDIYRSLKGSPLEKKLSPEVKRIFDRLLSGTDAKVENLQKGAKEAISAPITENGTETPPPTAEPPKVVENAPNEGNAEMTLGVRALNSQKLDQDIKDGIAKEGINYEPRGRKVRAEEAEEIINLFSKEEGGLDKIETMVYNTKNDIPADTRTYLNVYLAKELTNQKNSTTDPAERDRLRQKAIDLYMFGMEQGTKGGQFVEAQKEWGNVFGQSPEMVSAIVRSHIERRNKGFFANKSEELASAKKLLDDVFGSPEGRARIEEEVAQEIDKIGTKNFGAESKKKIDSFFNSLLIDPKQQQFYDALLGIPVPAWNGSVLAVKKKVLLRGDVASAIQKGVEYLDKWYKDEYTKGNVGTPDWNKADYEGHMKKQLGGLKKEVPIKERPAKRKEPKVKTPPTQEEMVNKLLEKMAGFATRKQLQYFMKDYMQELQEKGVVNDPQFRNLLAKALGMDYVSDKTEAKLTASAQTLGYAQKKIKEVIDLFDRLETIQPNTQEFTDLRKKLNEAKKEADKASFNAQKANQYIKTLLSDEPELLDKVSTLIQGNLLVPTSIIRNIYGNIFMAPARAIRYGVMNIGDAMLSQVGILSNVARAKIDPVKHPDMYRWAQKLPGTERTVNALASFRGFREGAWQGLKEGLRQVKTGQLEDDYNKKEIQRGLEPIKAAMRIRDALTGKEKRHWDKLVGDILESLPAGYMGEGMFRLLNLGDKPFRRAAEQARLSEIAKIKGYKGLQREKFLNNPDNASLEQAQKAGDLAVYTNDNFVSKIIEYANQTFKKTSKSDVNALKSASAIGKALFKLGKATTLPYVRTPVNLAIEAFEYAVPAYSFGRSMEAMYKGKRREALDFFGKAVVGSIISSVAITLIKSGVMTPAGSDEDKLKQAEFASKEGYRLNLDAFHRLIRGGDPTWKDGDNTVTLKGYGTLSMIFMAYGAAYKDKTPEEIEKETAPERWATVFGSVVTSSLEQSIMTGVNTALQAALRGEKERDRWLINTMVAMSSAVYPNTLSTLSKTFADENYLRETRDLSKEEGQLRSQMVNTFKDRLFMGKDLPTKVSIWGDQVKLIPDGNTWTYNLLGVSKNKKYQKYSFGTRMYEMYEDYKKINPDEAKMIFPSLPSPATKVGWEDSRMSPEELQNYQMRVGELRAEFAENYVNSEEFKDATLEDKTQKLTSMYSKARQIAESEMFSWINYKERNPLKWATMLEQDALPMLSMVKRLKQGNKEYKLSIKDTEMLNNIALGNYADKVVPWLEGNKENLVEWRKVNEKTGKSRFVERINDMWSKSLADAKREMLGILREKK